ncbi:molybdopterin-binding protein [Jatrophihabitans endophyticus]|uniref:TOBE domain-containing protein n=1 Tax=Jatrophihabitans endophyticus TaxID=1206085 RepID=UPI001A061376|nr:TOBE domain-containing protein [Jatrophihabitans endophyticus]MBE7189456.1 TOBE domain-containing protein [Jatrophihabitans endophyticus]
MSTYRVSEAAKLLGHSDDTMRRYIDSGRLESSRDDAGRIVIEGVELARFAVDDASPVPGVQAVTRESARNRFVGLVTRVVSNDVMAQVELQCGPYRVVSLMSREAADDLGLQPGVLAVASIKATNVVVGIPADQ